VAYSQLDWLHYLSSGRLQEVKNKRKFQVVTLKVVAVACEKWSVTNGSKYIDILENWSLRRSGRNRLFMFLLNYTTLSVVETLFISKFLHLPTHSSKVHFIFCKGGPMQFLPLLDGGGFVQVLVLVFKQPL